MNFEMQLFSEIDDETNLSVEPLGVAITSELRESI